MFYEAKYYTELMEKNRLPFFIPNGAQEEFIVGVGNAVVNGKLIQINAAANSIGKTTALCNIVGNVVFGAQTQWFKYPLFTDKWSAPKKIWYVSEADAFLDKIIPELKTWLPRGRYKTSKGGRKFDSIFEFDNGWSLTCKSFDQEPRQFESADVGLIIIDEPPYKEIFTACATRTRSGGLIVMGMTPLSHSAWLFDDLIENPDQQKYVQTYYADVEQACITHGVRGHLEHSRIEFMAEQFDEEEREARLHGKPKHLSGKIYKTLHPDVHKVTGMSASDFSQKENQIYCVMDIHDRRPPAIGWFAVSSDGKRYALANYPDKRDENYHTIKSTNLTYADACKIILNKEKEFGWDSSLILRFMDPNYGRRKVQALGVTIQEYLATSKVVDGEVIPGLYFVCDINDDLVEGHAQVRNALKVDMDGVANFRILEEAHHIWFQMNRYGIKEYTSRRAEVDGMSQKVAQKYKDFPDVVRYFIMVAQPFSEALKPPKPRESVPREADQMVDPAGFNFDWRNPNSTITGKL